MDGECALLREHARIYFTCTNGEGPTANSGLMCCRRRRTDLESCIHKWKNLRIVRRQYHSRGRRGAEHLMVHDPRLYSPQTTVAILAVLDWLCGEVERDERAPGPIEKARWEAKVPRQRQPTEAIIRW